MRGWDPRWQDPCYAISTLFQNRKTLFTRCETETYSRDPPQTINRTPPTRSLILSHPLTPPHSFIVMSLSLPNNENAVSFLPSPPGAKTPSSNPVHAFFTPRRPLSSIGLNSRSSRVHLLSPEESPSRRCSKRVRLSPSSSFSRDPPSSPIRCTESYIEPELTLVESRKRIQPSMQQRLFMRSLHGAGFRRGFHYAG